MTPDPPTRHARTGQAHRTADATKAAERKPEPTLLEQMGGIGGLAYSTVPVLVFVIVNAMTSLTPAIWASIGVAVAIAVFRLARKEPLQPALSGIFGVAIAAFIAYRTGSAKGYFAYGIWTSVVFAGAFLVSAIVRWPLAGVLWSAVNGTGMAWRKDRIARRYYDIATLVWILVFGSRFVVQEWLYNADSVGWLAFARIAMGIPLTAIAALVTVWAVRKADKRVKAMTATSAVNPAEAPAEETPTDGD
jgi:hypothetical protein